MDGVSDQVCIMCLRHSSRTESFVPGNPGLGCTYGWRHEYEEKVKQAPSPKSKIVDKKLCHKCGLHPKNPAFMTNNCEHLFA